MPKTLEEKAATFKALREACEAGSPAAEPEKKEDEAENQAAGAAEAMPESGGKPEAGAEAGSEAGAAAEAGKPAADADAGAGDAAADAAAKAAGDGGWKGSFKFRGQVVNLELTKEELIDKVMKGHHADVLIKERDQAVRRASRKEVDDYYKSFGFVQQGDDGSLRPSEKGAFKWLEAAFGPEKAKQFAMEYAGGKAAGAEGTASLDQDLARIDA